MAETRNCQNCKTEFRIESEDFAFYEKFQVPPPTFCPDCRFERRAAYRNERKVFWNTSAKSGIRMLSLYSPRSGVTAYHEDEWKRDDWDALEYGREYDFSRPFFSQLHELAKAVPRHARSVEPGSNINSDYVANASHCKNCYLVFNSEDVEDSAYATAIEFARNCFDAANAPYCERSYEIFWTNRCHRTHFSIYCKECTNVTLSRNCVGCSDCVGCANLHNKKYCIFNVQYSKEEYDKKIDEMRLDTWIGLKKAISAARAFWLTQPIKYIEGYGNVDVTGSYVTRSRNVHKGYLVRGGENMRYCQYQPVPPNKDCMDITVWGGGNELCYENATCGWGAFNSRFCVECWPESRNNEYSMFLRNCNDCFGCVGLKNKSFCIFNRQYSEGEFQTLRAKIVAHMNEMPYVDAKGNIYRYGEFFPIELSPFGHNTAIAGEHFPLSEEECLAAGYPWDDPEVREYEITMQSEGLPDAVGDVKDDILNQVIACSECRKAYRILKMELDFLREEKIPLPRSCPDCRHKRRIADRNSFRLYERKCRCGGKFSKEYENTAKHFHGTNICPNEFETSYSPDRPEIVYCETCYQAEVA